MNKNKGITLVALVITVVILLILAGITIATLTGNNGLFARAKQAKNNTLYAQEQENIALKSFDSTINSIIDGAREQITVDRDEYEQLLQDVEYLKTELSISNDEREKLEEKVDAIQLTSGGFSLEKIGDSGGTTSWTEISVQNGISQYRYLYFVFNSEVGETIYNTHIMSTIEFKENCNSSSNYLRLYLYNSIGKYADFYYNSDTSIYRRTSNYSCTVYGIK